MQCFLAFFVLLFGPWLASAQESSQRVAQEELLTLPIETSANRLECQDIAWRYSIRPPQSSKHPLVLYFAGGPSLPTRTSASFPIPKEFGLLRFEYPGVAENRALKHCGPWSSRAIAALVQQALYAHLAEHPRQEYLIYGLSYGSIPATILSNLLESDARVHPPKLLVLEGTIGKAFEGRDALDGFYTQWRNVRKLLPRSAREVIRQSLKTRCTEEDWGAWIEYALSIGASPGRKPLIEETLLRFADSKVSVGACPKAGLENSVSAEALEVYRQVICEELNRYAPNAAHSFRLKDFSLEPMQGNVCINARMSRPYSVKEWPITKTPIVYFVGENDPVTPPWQARYHRKRQQKTGRVVVSVENAAHNPLSVSLSDCAERVFSALLISTPELRARVARECQQQTSIEVYAPR